MILHFLRIQRHHNCLPTARTNLRNQSNLARPQNWANFLPGSCFLIFCTPSTHLYIIYLIRFLLYLSSEVVFFYSSSSPTLSADMVEVEVLLKEGQRGWTDWICTWRGPVHPAGLRPGPGETESPELVVCSAGALFLSSVIIETVPTQ